MKLKPLNQFSTGILLVLVSAFLFSAKAILAKLVYAQMPIDVITVLFMRMLYAAPFYVVSLLLVLKQKGGNRADGKRLEWRRLLSVSLLGMLGYYISSFFDFWGLQFVSAGLERVILFAYPSIVVLIETFVFKKPFTRIIAVSLLLCYAGIIISYAADIQFAGSGSLAGSLSIFICAITFACYVVLSGKIITSTGVSIFTPVAMLAATIAIMLHAAVAGAIPEAGMLSLRMHFYFLLMGVFATVVPSYLTVMGLRLIGSSHVAIVSSVGPLATIFLAWWILDEPFGLWQLLGSALVIGGVLLLSQKGRQ